MSITVCMLMITSISASITQNVKQSENVLLSGTSPTSGGSGGLADSPWPMFRQNLRHTGLSPYDTSGNNGQLKWSFTIGEKVYSSPAIGSDGTIYVGSFDHKLYAINSNGTEKWNFRTGSFVDDSSPAIGSDGTIYIGSRDNKLYAVNPDGTEKWNFTTGDDIGSSPAIGADGTIYIGSNDNNLYAINPDGTEKWRFTADDVICSSPAIGFEDTIYIGSGDHKLYAINSDGTEKWNFTTGFIVNSSPAIGSDGTIYVGSYDGKLYAINPSGTEKWNFKTDGNIYSSPAIASDGTIYVGSYNNKFYAINPDGTEKWCFTTGDDVYSSPVIGSDGTIYMGSCDKKLYAINPNGDEKWNFTIGSYIHSSPAIGSDGTIYIGSYGDKLYAIGNPNLQVSVTSHFSELNSAAQSTISVNVTYGTNPVQGATVNLVSDNGGIFSPQSGITDANGDFESIFNAPTVTSQIICRISAEASKTGYNNGSEFVDVTINPIPWPMFRHNLNHTGQSPYDTSSNNGMLKWSFLTGARVVSSPAIGSDGTIYVGSYDNKFYAINPDGTQKWNFITGGEVFSSPSIGSDGIIYVGSHDNKLYAINPDGTEKWSFTTGDMVYSSAAIGSDGTIYVGSHDHKIYAINSDGTLKWDFTTGQSVRSLPTIGFDGTIYISSYDHKIYAINPDGSEKWNFVTGGKVASSPAISSDGTIYVGSQDEKLYAINHEGIEKWNFTTSGWIWASPAIGSDGTIYVGSYDDKIYAINLDGSEKWNFTTSENIHSSPAIGSDGTIYIGSDDGILYAINSDGTEKWNFTTDGIVFSSPAIDVDGTIYVGSYDNKLYAINGHNQPPIANAGPDQTVYEGDVVQFDGSGSGSPMSGGTPSSGSTVTQLLSPSELGSGAMTIDFEGLGSPSGTSITDQVPGLSFTYTSVVDPAAISNTPGIQISAATSGTGAAFSAGSRVDFDSSVTEVGMFVSPSFITYISGSSSIYLNMYLIALDASDNQIGYVSIPVLRTTGDTSEITNFIPVFLGLRSETQIHVIYIDWNLPFDFNGNTLFYDDLTMAQGGNPNPTQIVSYEWDFDSSDGLWWETGATPDATIPTPTHTYGDDGVFIATLRVTDNDNLSATDICNITVLNVDPTVTIESTSMEVEIGLRVTGRKYNNVSMTLFEDNISIGSVSIERLPGSPNVQMAWIPVSIDFSKSYLANVTFTPEDPPNVGANPVWIYIKSQNGTINQIHHTFNVQQSKKRNSSHWNHVEPWEVELNPHFIGLGFEITSHVNDPGSDDETLTYSYGTQNVIVTYLNNPPNPDLYPSPEVNPMNILDTMTLIYEGPGTVTLVVKDDDNIRLGVGEGTGSIIVA